jgi:hypothetical protein
MSDADGEEEDPQKIVAMTDVEDRALEPTGQDSTGEESKGQGRQRQNRIMSRMGYDRTGAGPDRTREDRTGWLPER